MMKTPQMVHIGPSVRSRDALGGGLWIRASALVRSRRASDFMFIYDRTKIWTRNENNYISSSRGFLLCTGSCQFDTCT